MSLAVTGRTSPRHAFLMLTETYSCDHRHNLMRHTSSNLNTIHCLSEINSEFPQNWVSYFRTFQLESSQVTFFIHLGTYSSWNSLTIVNGCWPPSSCWNSLPSNGNSWFAFRCLIRAINQGAC